MKKIFIDLDGGKKLNLGTLDTFVSKKFRLRTVDKNQFQARINLGLKDDRNTYLLGSTYLESLSPSENGFSYLHCLLKKENRRLSLVIKNGRRTVCRENFSLLPRKVLFRYIFWSAAGVILAAGLVFFLLTFDFSGIGGKGPVSSSSAQSSSRDVREDPAQAEITQGQSALPSKPETEAGTLSGNSQGNVQPVTAEEEESKTTESGDQVQGGMEGEERKADTTLASAGSDVGAERTEPDKPDFSLPDKEDLVLYFTPNSAVLSRDTMDSLGNVLSFLLDYPSLHVTITGHCAIAGTEAGRKEISVTRAVNVEKWLRREGWNPEYPPQVKGEAGNYPLTRDPENQEINRRVEIEISE